MEKRTSPLTVMLEPSIHDILRANIENISTFVHDMLIQYLRDNDMLSPPEPRSLEPARWQEPAEGTITKICANCHRTDIPLEWEETQQAYYCPDSKTCYEYLVSLSQRRKPMTLNEAIDYDIARETGKL
jgi:hypothetical protein